MIQLKSIYIGISLKLTYRQRHTNITSSHNQPPPPPPHHKNTHTRTHTYTQASCYIFSLIIRVLPRFRSCLNRMEHTLCKQSTISICWILYSIAAHSIVCVCFLVSVQNRCSCIEMLHFSMYAARDKWRFSSLFLYLICLNHLDVCLCVLCYFFL